MKICIFTETYYPVVGGGETQAKLLANELADAGHPVTILTRRSDASLKRYERYGEIEVYRLSPAGSGQMRKWGLLLSSLPALVKLRARYDVIFVSGFRIIGISAVLAGKLLRKPVVLKSDSQGEMSGAYFEPGLKKVGFSRSNLLFKFFIGFRNSLLRTADAFSAISKEIAAEYRSNGVRAEKIHRIPNGVDTSCFFPSDAARKAFLRDRLNLPQSAKIVIYTGRLVSYKGLPLLLEAWNKIRLRHPDALLILVGSGGQDIHNFEDQLRAYVAAEGLEKVVMFTGAVQNVADYLQASDIFAFPTENEAFGASLVEAMACALPSAASSVGAVPDFIQHQHNGLLVEPRNFEQLHAALDSLLSDPAQASRLGAAALETARQRFSSDMVTAAYLSLFHGLMRE